MKAFYMVSELLKMLPHIDVVSSSLNWLKSYLDNRTQKVRIDEITGNEMLINYGIPQGSVLGPIVFILYIDSICS